MRRSRPPWLSVSVPAIVVAAGVRYDVTGAGLVDWLQRSGATGVTVFDPATDDPARRHRWRWAPGTATR